MGSSEENVNLVVAEENINDKVTSKCSSDMEESLAETTESQLCDPLTAHTEQDDNTLKESENIVTAMKRGRRKSRHGKKGHGPAKDIERSTIRRVHYPGTKFKQGRKRAQTFPTLTKFFLPHKRPRQETFIPPTKFLLGGNISDPLNLNSLQDEDINRAMNAVTPQSSPLPTPPRHKAKIDVIIPPNIRDPLNLMEPLDNAEYEKRMEMQQRKPRKRPKPRRRTTEGVTMFQEEKTKPENQENPNKSETLPEPSTSRARKRSCSDSASQKGKDGKKLRRMDSLDKIVSPVVPQPGAWMRARGPPRPVPSDRPATPKQRTKSEGDEKMPVFHPKNTRYQYGNYDRYYGYRNLNAMMDVRLQVFEMNKYLFQNKDVLDIGCNVGHISLAVARTFGARSVVGIDIDPVLIGRARKNLRSYIPVPVEQPKIEEDKKSVECDKCIEIKCEDYNTESKLGDKGEDVKKTVSGRKIRRPRKNRKALGKHDGQCYFPMSFTRLYGPLGVPTTEIKPPTFPYNVSFKQGNYVPRDDVAIGYGGDSPQFDLILCLSTIKWIHLNWGDAGLKRTFRKMFADLRPGGKLVLEAQNWSSYKKKKRLTHTIYENFNSIELLPNKFRDYLLSPEVGFSKYCILGIPEHTSKGFRRPIHLYIKGDFTPSQACWSDAYAPSSLHKPEVEPPIRTVYAPVEPAYQPSDDAPSCGAATPYSPNFENRAYGSPFCNLRSDSHAPMYAPPLPTVYATLPSLLEGGASPSASPVASPAFVAPSAPEPLSARVYPAFSPRPHED